MSRLDDLRRRARETAAPLLAASVIAYFGYHAIQGDRGLIAWLELAQRIDDTRAALAQSRAEEARLAHRVALLRPDGLDRDMLDEQARRLLNLVEPDDLCTFETPAATPR